MENINTLPVNLSLGELEISIQDLVNLRPGSIIEFERPETLNGSLKLGSDDWVKVTLEFKDQKVIIKVA